MAYIGNVELKPYTSLVLMGKAAVPEVGAKGRGRKIKCRLLCFDSGRESTSCTVMVHKIRR